MRPCRAEWGIALSAVVLSCNSAPPAKLADDKEVVCDLEKARAAMPELELRCAEGDAKSCFVLGTMIHGRPWCGPVTPQPDRIRAWGLFEKACLLGEEESCYALENGAGTRWRVDAPAAQLEEGCRAEVGYACYLRGQQLKEAFWDSLSPESQEETIRDGLRKAIREAHPWFERACARDIQEGCFEEAWVLMHGPKAERAVTLLENACRDWRGRHNRVVDSALSCIWLAKAYEEGLGVARDWQRARTMLHEVCQLDQVCNDLYLVDSSNRRR
jgi:TPR repeat protein